FREGLAFLIALQRILSTGIQHVLLVNGQLECCGLLVALDRLAGRDLTGSTRSSCVWGTSRSDLAVRAFGTVSVGSGRAAHRGWGNGEGGIARSIIRSLLSFPSRD